MPQEFFLDIRPWEMSCLKCGHRSSLVAQWVKDPVLLLLWLWLQLGLHSIPGPGISTCSRYSQKKKKSFFLNVIFVKGGWGGVPCRPGGWGLGIVTAVAWVQSLAQELPHIPSAAKKYVINRGSGLHITGTAGKTMQDCSGPTVNFLSQYFVSEFAYQGHQSSKTILCKMHGICIFSAHTLPFPSSSDK